MRRAISTLLTVAMLALLATASVNANSERVTEGDVEAHFQASYLGGWRAPLDQTPPSAWFHAGIRPFVGSPWDGSEQCVQDWHVLLLNFTDGPPFAFSRADAESFFDTLEVRMYLDDVQFDEKRSALKTFKEDGERFWFHAYGKNYAPGTLELGQHSFRVEYDSIYFQGTDGPITFTVVEC